MIPTVLFIAICDVKGRYKPISGTPNREPTPLKNEVHDATETASSCMNNRDSCLAVKTSSPPRANPSMADVNM